MHSVISDGRGAYVVVDITTGKRLNRFNIPGDLIAGPVVNGGACMIQTRSGNVLTAYTVKIPSGHIINRYTSSAD
jgi:hypothetical protein